MNLLFIPTETGAVSFRRPFCFFRTYFNIVSALSANLCCVSGNINCLPSPAIFYTKFRTRVKRKLALLRCDGVPLEKKKNQVCEIHREYLGKKWRNIQVRGSLEQKQNFSARGCVLRVKDRWGSKIMFVRNRMMLKR